MRTPPTPPVPRSCLGGREEIDAADVDVADSGCLIGVALSDRRRASRSSAGEVAGWICPWLMMSMLRACWSCDSTSLDAVLDPLAKFKAVTQKQGPLGELVLTYTKSSRRRDDPDFKSKYIEWLKALHELEALQAKPTAFRAEASTYCGYCFKETGKKFTNHTDADCRRKAGRSKDNDKASMGDKSDKGDKTNASGKSDQRGSGRGPWCHICETNCHKTSECRAKVMLLQAVRAVGKGAVATISDSNEPATDGDQYSSASALYLHLATSALSDTSPAPRGDPPLQHETSYRFRVPPLWRTKYNIGDPDLTKPFEVDFKIPRRLPKRARRTSQRNNLLCRTRNTVHLEQRRSMWRTR